FLRGARTDHGTLPSDRPSTLQQGAADGQATMDEKMETLGSQNETPRRLANQGRRVHRTDPSEEPVHGPHERDQTHPAGSGSARGPSVARAGAGEGSERIPHGSATASALLRLRDLRLGG